MRKYLASVYTGDKTCAGTDANVYLEIQGTRGDTGTRYLLKSLNNKHMFESDQVGHQLRYGLIDNQSFTYVTVFMRHDVIPSG